MDVFRHVWSAVALVPSLLWISLSWQALVTVAVLLSIAAILGFVVRDIVHLRHRLSTLERQEEVNRDYQRIFGHLT